MRLRALGPLELGPNGGDWRRIGAPKQRLLLATLLTSSGPVSSDRLIDELWAERRPRDPANRLQVLILRLRKALGDQAGNLLRTHQPGYELAIPSADIDIENFESLAHKGFSALDAGEVETASALLGDSLRLWRGQPFADVASTPAIRAEVDRLWSFRLTVVEARIDADLAIGRHARLVAELQALVAEEPFRESLWANLMLALYRSGQQAASLDTYRRIHALLANELGVQPGAPLQRLHRLILDADSALDWRPATLVTT